MVTAEQYPEENIQMVMRGEVGPGWVVESVILEGILQDSSCMQVGGYTQSIWPYQFENMVRGRILPTTWVGRSTQ